jgi:hypothetical protein
VIVFPLAACLMAFACAATVGVDWRRRPKPDKAAWFVAFALFAVAAGAEVLGATLGWTAPLARIYYLAGAILVVGFLALGELYLLAPARISRVAPGAALLVTALAATVVLDAPVAADRLASEGWRAIERGPTLVALAVGINAGGTAVLVGGALWSAWRFLRLGIYRHRAIGCVLIALGTLLVAAGGSATRLGRPEFLYLAMAAGIAVILAGYLETRRPETPKTSAPVAAAEPPVALVALRSGHASDGDDGISLISAWMRDLDPETVSARCRAWSASPDESETLSRAQAREAWALRLRLPAEAKPAFDSLPPTAQRQLAEVYFGVFVPAPSTERGGERTRHAAG